RLADPAPAVSDTHAYALEQSAGRARAAQPGNDGQLQAAGDLTVHLGDEHLVAALRRDGVERVPVRLGERLSRLLARRPERVVREEAHDGRDVCPAGEPYVNVRSGRVAHREQEVRLPV